MEQNSPQSKPPLIPSVIKTYSSLSAVGAILIQQGAEARAYRVDFFEKVALVKERFVKQYRNPVLDKKLSQRRVKSEARCMERCLKSGIDVPKVYYIDTLNRRLWMEFIEGETAVSILRRGVSEKEKEKISIEIGTTLAKMHDADICHGDLTTSNLIFRPNGSLAVIDFGLSFVSQTAEDKGVDIYVLERAFLSTHPNSENLFQDILKTYGKTSKNADTVFKKLEEVRLRGRKKLAFG